MEDNSSSDFGDHDAHREIDKASILEELRSLDELAKEHNNLYRSSFVSTLARPAEERTIPASSDVQLNMSLEPIKQQRTSQSSYVVSPSSWHAQHQDRTLHGQDSNLIHPISHTALPSSTYSGDPDNAQDDCIGPHFLSNHSIVDQTSSSSQSDRCPKFQSVAPLYTHQRHTIDEFNAHSRVQGLPPHVAVPRFGTGEFYHRQSDMRGSIAPGDDSFFGTQEYHSVMSHNYGASRPQQHGFSTSVSAFGMPQGSDSAGYNPFANHSTADSFRQYQQNQPSFKFALDPELQNIDHHLALRSGPARQVELGNTSQLGHANSNAQIMFGPATAMENSDLANMYPSYSPAMRHSLSIPDNSHLNFGSAVSTPVTFSHTRIPVYRDPPVNNESLQQPPSSSSTQEDLSKKKKRARAPNKLVRPEERLHETRGRRLNATNYGGTNEERENFPLFWDLSRRLEDLLRSGVKQGDLKRAAFLPMKYDDGTPLTTAQFRSAKGHAVMRILKEDENAYNAYKIKRKATSDRAARNRATLKAKNALEAKNNLKANNASSTVTPTANDTANAENDATYHNPDADGEYVMDQN